MSEEDYGRSANWRNALNLIGYALNAGIVYGINSGGFGGGDNGEISDKYQTIITPAAWAFAIWGLIYTFQGIFTVAQLFPRVAPHPMVQDGVNIWYFLTCLFQVGWMFSFTYEVIWLSLIFMVLIEWALVTLEAAQYKTVSDGSYLEYWLLRFPFDIHCGWITAATLLNISLFLVDVGASSTFQLVVGVISYIVILAVVGLLLFYIRKPKYEIALVLSWASVAIFSELNNPKDSIEKTFTDAEISGMKIGALVVCITILILVLVRLIKAFQAQNVDELQQEKEFHREVN